MKCLEVSKFSSALFFFTNKYLFLKKRVGEKTIKGIHTYEYTFLENELDNGAVNKENKCFCRKGFCLKPGLIDVTDCYYGKTNKNR